MIRDYNTALGKGKWKFWRKKGNPTSGRVTNELLYGIIRADGGRIMIENNKVGVFIAQCRKEKNMTQKQLGEKLNVTDRAVSKWETGRSFPDVSLLEALCRELDISVSELLAGKKLEQEQYQEETEKMLMASVSAGQLMGLQVVLHVLTLIVFLLMDFPFVRRAVSGTVLLDYTGIFCWVLAVVLIFCIDYLDKKMPAKKFRSTNVNLERLVGGATFLVLMGVNLIIGGGVETIRELGWTEKIYATLLVIVGLGISVGVRGIKAESKREEWEMEWERKEKEK